MRGICSITVHLLRPARTVADVKIGDVSTAVAAPLPSASRIESVAHVEAEAAGGQAQSIHEARLSAVVALIESLTGREVKLVPPAAYLVSRPAPLEAPVDVVVRADIGAVSGSASGPLEVGIHSILQTGTANRMVLRSNVLGGLDLSTAVDVEI